MAWMVQTDMFSVWTIRHMVPAYVVLISHRRGNISSLGTWFDWTRACLGAFWQIVRHG